MADLTARQEAGGGGASFGASVREDGPRLGAFSTADFSGFETHFDSLPISRCRLPVLTLSSGAFHPVPSQICGDRLSSSWAPRLPSWLSNQPCLGVFEKTGTPWSLPSTQCTPGLSALPTLPVSDDEAGICFDRGRPRCRPLGPGRAFPPLSPPVPSSFQTCAPPNFCFLSLASFFAGHPHRSPPPSHTVGLLRLSMASSSRFYSFGTSEGQRCPSRGPVALRPSLRAL